MLSGSELSQDDIHIPGFFLERRAVVIFSPLTWLRGRSYDFFTKATVMKRKSAADLFRWF